jgi:hypothetical protein
MCGPDEDVMLELPEGVKLKENGFTARIFDVMRDQQYRTLQNIKEEAGIDAPLQNVAARLRDLRKASYGGFTVEKYPLYDGFDKKTGEFEYRLSN